MSFRTSQQVNIRNLPPLKVAPAFNAGGPLVFHLPPGNLDLLNPFSKNSPAQRP